MRDDMLTIRQMCDRYHVTPRALRFYESRELLFPLRDGQRRLYDHRDRGRLQLILRGKRFGIALEEIRQLLELYVPGDPNREQTRATLDVARARLVEMRRQQAELAEAVEELSGLIATAETVLHLPDITNAATTAPHHPDKED